jgi:conjugal transfer pilus assembly protein TraB
VKAVFKNILDRLSTRQKQIVVLVAIIVVTVGLVMIISYSMDKSGKKTAAAGKTTSAKKMTLMADKVEKDLWVAAEGQNIKALEKSNEEMRSQMEKMKKEIEETKEQAKKSQSRVVSPPPLPPPAPSKQAVPTVPRASCAGPSCPPAVGPTPLPSSLQEARPQASQAGSQSSMGTPRPGTAKPSDSGSSGAGGTIRMFKGDERKSDAKSTKDKKREDPTTYLPAGSFMQAVLLSGLDAPTSGGKSTAEPYPVLLGVTDLSVLPNRFRMNLKECFIIGAGYGNISDERAYIRTETLSCVRTDNRVIEVSMKGQVMGEDGKLGMRGRLVSKQGQQIAMAIFAGTLGGLSTALTPQQTPQFNMFANPTQSNTSIGYARPSLGDVGQVAALGGAGNALNMIANYYMKMAERLFPIIEIDAGRTVEIVVLKGQELKVAGGSRTKQMSSKTQ